MSLTTSSLGRRITRRTALKGGAIGAAGLAGAALIGCSDDDGGSSEPQAQTSQPKPGGTLRMGQLSDATSLEPHLISGLHYENLWPIYDSLTKYDLSLKANPRLATSWETSDGGATFVLKLRSGVTFHTGREFTSADVKW